MRKLIATTFAVSGVLACGVQMQQADARPKRLYLAVHDSSTPNLLHTYSVATDGTLTPTAGSPVNTGNTAGTCGGYCQSLAYSAKRKLYFTSGSAGISVTDFSGATPTLVTGSPFGAKMDGVAVVEKGRNTFVYGSSYQTDQILGFRVLPDRTLQALPGSPFAAGDGPDGMTAARDLLFVANENADTVGSYKVGADGRLTPAPGAAPAVPGDSFIYNVNVDPSGKFVYVGDCGDVGQVFGFSVNQRTAALTALPGSPFAVGSPTVCSGVVLAAKNLAFALDDGNAATNIQALRKSAKGSLVSLGAVQNSVDNGVTLGAADPKGRFLASVSKNTNTIRLFTINKRTGVVTPASALTQAVPRANGALFVEK